MIIVPGQAGKDLCDPQLGMTRRDILRVGGSGLLGLSLGSMLELQAVSARAADVTGGKRAVPRAGARPRTSSCSIFREGPATSTSGTPRRTSRTTSGASSRRSRPGCPGIDVTENLPKLAQLTDKFTFIRSMSYTPNGLFNHTAAIYQMMTGYTTDKVSPSGQLEPPSPKDFPNFGSQIIRLQPQNVPMLPFVMLPRPLQESGVVGKGGTAGFLGKAFDPYTLYPEGDDMDMNKMDRIKVDDLQLRPEVFAMRLQRRARLRDALNAGMKSIDAAVSDYKLNEYYDRALSLVVSGRARDAFNLQAEPAKTRDLYGRNTFGQSCLLARRLIEAGTKVVEVIWPKVANSDNHSWDHHVDLTNRMRDRSGPMLDQGLSGLLTDLDQRGMLAGDAWWWPSASSAAARRRGSAPRATATAPTAATTGPIATPAVVAGAGIKRGHVHGKSDKTGSTPLSDPVHPGELLATIYHAFGIDPATMVLNHLNQPRELVKAEAVTRLFG